MKVGCFVSCNLVGQPSHSTEARGYLGVSQIEAQSHSLTEHMVLAQLTVMMLTWIGGVWWVLTHACALQDACTLATAWVEGQGQLGVVGSLLYHVSPRD